MLWFQPTDIVHIGNVYSHDTYDEVGYRSQPYVDQLHAEVDDLDGIFWNGAAVTLFLINREDAAEISNSYDHAFQHGCCF